MEIFNTQYPFDKVFVIAEAGSNHNGSLDTAVELVRQAARCKADAIKFQEFSLESLFSREHYSAVLNLKNREWERHVRECAFRSEWRETILREARSNGITYFSTPFSTEIVDEIDPFVSLYKIASCDITFSQLIKKIASKGKGVFISTGASQLEEIDHAVSTLRDFNLPFLCLMHCIMLYPPTPDQLHLNFIQTLKERFGLPVGFSDHSAGLDAALCAVAKGACAIEKHFTLDKKQEGADHSNSLDPGELRTLIQKIRLFEQMLGSHERPISEREVMERVYARRSLYAARNVKKGKRISEDDLCSLRPNIAVGTEHIDEVIGRKALRDIARGEPIDLSMIQ